MTYSSSTKWNKYYEQTAILQPSLLLVKAISETKLSDTALDFGCGSGRDTAYLLSLGFSVTAIDKNIEQMSGLKKVFGDKLSVMKAMFEELVFPFQAYDLINAHWSLPFINKMSFNDVFTRLLSSLNEDGILVGQFFGLNDEWNTPGTLMSFHTKQEVLELLKQMNILYIKESDEDGKTANGAAKHWHVFHFIARKPSISK